MDELAFTIDDVPATLRVERAADRLKVQLPSDESHELSNLQTVESTVVFTVTDSAVNGDRRGSRRLEVPFAEIGDAIVMSWQGSIYRFRRQRSGVTAAAPPERSGSVFAPTGGVVADLPVNVGQQVEAFQTMAVIEAMKVMTLIEAPIAGTIVEVAAERGKRIEQGELIARIEPSDTSPAG